MDDKKKQLNTEEMFSIVEKNIRAIKDKQSNVYFFVIDSKGTPSGMLEYIYQTALTLQKKGYKVSMLHQEKDFVGVGDWLGEAFAALPHHNIETENVEITAADFLFIPEIFENVMASTSKLPCKRVIILQNYKYLAEFFPISATPDKLKIYDVITTTKVQEGIVKSYFPQVNVHIVPPAIQNKFRKATKPQKLVVNVVARNQEDLNRVMKPFYWKYPIYQWVSFRDLRGMGQENFCEALREGAITVWLDDETNFGYAALEAMRCGTILLAKIPQTLSDWNVEKSENGENQITDACVWFDHTDRVPEILASVVRTWTLDQIPDAVYEKQHKFDGYYTVAEQEREIEKVYVGEIFEQRIKDFESVAIQLKNKLEKEK